METLRSSIACLKRQCFHSTPLIVVLGISAGLFGCHSPSGKLIRQREITKQSEELGRRYLEADVDNARQCLLQDAKLLEEGTVLEPIGRAQLLSLTYLRLYVLERRVGNDAPAQANLIKAQYWSLKKGELTEVTIKEAIRQINEFSATRITEYIDEFDRRHNGGKAPQYLQALQVDSSK